MKHITILGGGLAGWCLFEHLIRLGHDPESLLLIEKEVSANGASGVLEGMLHPFTGRTLYPKAGALEAWAYSKQWLLEQHNQSGLPIFTPKALWRIATDEKTQEQFERSFLRAQAEISNYPVTPLNSTAPLEKVKAGYVFAGAGHVNIQQLLAYFQHRYRPHRLLHQSLRPLHKAPQGHWCITTETKPSRGAGYGRRSQSFFSQYSPAYQAGRSHSFSSFTAHSPLRQRRRSLSRSPERHRFRC